MAWVAFDCAVLSARFRFDASARFASRDLDLFADQTLSAMRKQFGGHAEQPAD